MNYLVKLEIFLELEDDDQSKVYTPELHFSKPAVAKQRNIFISAPLQGFLLLQTEFWIPKLKLLP